MCLLPRCPFVWCALNESPSEKEGKSLTQSGQFLPIPTLNESPSEKEGKYLHTLHTQSSHHPQ